MGTAVCRAPTSRRSRCPDRRALALLCVSTPPALTASVRYGKWTRAPRDPVALAAIGIAVGLGFVVAVACLAPSAGESFFKAVLTANKPLVQAAFTVACCVVTGVVAAVFSHALELGYKWRMAERQKEDMQKPIHEWAKEARMEDLLTPEVVDQLRKEGLGRMGSLAAAAAEKPTWVEGLLCERCGMSEGKAAVLVHWLKVVEKKFDVAT